MKSSAYFVLILVSILFLTFSCAKPKPTPAAEPIPQTISSSPSVTDSPPTAESAPQPTSSSAPASTEDNPRFSTYGWKTDFSKHSVPYSEIISGGVGKDGIPPIYTPKFENVPQAGVWLTDGDPVAFLQIGEQVRGYPIRILTGMR